MQKLKLEDTQARLGSVPGGGIDLDWHWLDILNMQGEMLYRFYLSPHSTVQITPAKCFTQKGWNPQLKFFSVKDALGRLGLKDHSIKLVYFKPKDDITGREVEDRGFISEAPYGGWILCDEHCGKWAFSSLNDAIAACRLVWGKLAFRAELESEEERAVTHVSEVIFDEEE